MNVLDADKIGVFLDHQYHNCHGYMGNKKEIYREALLAVKSYIHKEKQIDAEPVVRCKECEYHHWEQEPCHGKTVHYCDLPEMRSVKIYKDFFCGFAKRKGGAKMEKGKENDTETKAD